MQKIRGPHVTWADQQADVAGVRLCIRVAGVRLCVRT